MKLNASWQRKSQYSSVVSGVVTDPAVATEATLPRAVPETTLVAHIPAHLLVDAIQDRWSLLTDADLRDVGTREQLIAALQSRYRITPDQATTQVREWVARNTRQPE
jgi:hypothetical protein